MTDTTPLKMNRDAELPKPEQAGQHAQDDNTSPPVPQAPQNETDSLVQSTTPGRKPLFRS